MKQIGMQQEWQC